CNGNFRAGKIDIPEQAEVEWQIGESDSIVGVTETEVCAAAGYAGVDKIVRAFGKICARYGSGYSKVGPTDSLSENGDADRTGRRAKWHNCGDRVLRRARHTRRHAVEAHIDILGACIEVITFDHDRCF